MIKTSNVKMSNDEFMHLTKKKKKEFLSADLMNRIIRVEQRISASFGKPVYYNNTEFYRGLSERDKQNYEKYIRRRKLNKFISPIVLVGFIILAFSMGGRLTGSTIVNIESSIGSFILFLVILGIVAIAIFSFIHRRNREKRLNRHLRVLKRYFS